MTVAQLLVIALLAYWGRGAYAGGVALLLAAQLLLMRPLLERPKDRAAWYSATGVTLYVLGMLLTAVALRRVGA
jgi:chlorophyll synthase